MRFRLRTLMIVLVFVSICLGGMVWRWKLDNERLNWFYRIAGMVSTSPYWVPAVFGAYAIGQRKVTVTLVSVFAFAEAAAVGAVIGLHRLMTP